MTPESRTLILPTRDYQSSVGSYGDLKTAAMYCGLRGTPRRYPGEWQHGWLSEEYNYHPEDVVGGNGMSRLQRTKRRFFVARDDQRDFLLSQGYRDVHSIGLPIVYVEKPLLHRIRGSLLVMPTHSLSTSREQWLDDEYSDYVASVAKHFTKVTVCVHQSCVEKNNWIRGFQHLDVTIVPGADEKDQNSLERIASLMSQHEYLTSNSFGSHIAYGSYFGCKVSVVGPEPSFDRASLENQPLFVNAPRLLDEREEWARRNHRKQRFPQFHCQPWQATENKAWAEWQLGKQCKRSPEELKRLFGWTLADRVAYSGRRLLGTGARELKRDVRWCRSLGPFVGLLASIQLRSVFPNKRETGLSRLFYSPTRSLLLRNGSSDFAVFEQHFLRREILDINFRLKDPSIILDFGANVGVSVAAFRLLFPSARIVAFELSSENAALCARNHESDRLVKVANCAIWSADGFVGVTDVGDGAWALQVEPAVINSGASVPAFKFETVLEDNGIDIVDIMKMDIEGAEAEVFEASASSIFARTRVSIVEVHDWIDGVPERVHRVVEQHRKQYQLDVEYHGEFWVITNRTLLAKM